jgi:hypothetical protein
LFFKILGHAEHAGKWLKLRWNFGIIGLVAGRNVSVKFIWEIPVKN